jgi:hypothetical protein
MSLIPTKEAVIGQYINGRNAAFDFLQLATNHGGTVFGWIDSDGHLQGSLKDGLGTGTVTSVAFVGDGTIFSSTPSTPVTTSGNIAGALLTQNANLILAGPTTGVAAFPTFRSLVTADLPASTISGSISATQVAFGSGVNAITGSANFTFSSGFVTLNSPNTGPTNVTGAVLAMTNSSGTVPSYIVKGADDSLTIRNGSQLIAALGLVKLGPNGDVLLTATDSMLTIHGTTSGIYGQGAAVLTLFATGGGEHSFAVVNTTNNGRWNFDISTNQANWFGTTSGFAGIGVAAAAGTPNKINLPLTTGTAGQVLTTDGANPQQTSWTTVGGSTPSLDQVTNPVATKTFTLGANSLTFTGTTGTSSFNVNEAGSGGVNLVNTGTGGFFISDTSTAGLNLAETGAGQIFIRSTVASTGPGILLESDNDTGGITLLNNTVSGSSGGTAIQDTSPTGITVQSTGAGGIFIQATSGAGGITEDTSSGTGPIALHTNATGGLTIQHAAGAATPGVNAGPFTTVSSIKTIDGIVVTLTGTSDERLKTNTQPFTRGLTAITAITPSTYQWNEAGQKITGFSSDSIQTGFIAQDVQKAIPEAIGQEGEYLSLDTRPILAAIVNAVKELAAENKDLKARLVILESR